MGVVLTDCKCNWRTFHPDGQRDLHAANSWLDVGGTLFIATTEIPPISTPISIVVEQLKRLIKPFLNLSS